MAVSKARKLKWVQDRSDGIDPLQAAWDSVQRWKADPLSYSRLPYWLGLEVWTVTEGLLVLAGVEPDSVSLHPSLSDPFENAEWLHAQPFAEHMSFSFLPEAVGLTEEHFGGDSDAFESYLQRCENREDVLDTLRNAARDLWHTLDHSPSALGPHVVPYKWRPVAFLGWAKSIRFQPSWYGWAAKNRLLPDALDALAAPYFDSESDSYPKLLHIAVRAWEEASKASEGTPKQRIEHFLNERYPDLSTSTRDAIALIANWRKAGGRPRRRD